MDTESTPASTSAVGPAVPTKLTLQEYQEQKARQEARQRYINFQHLSTHVTVQRLAKSNLETKLT